MNSFHQFCFSKKTSPLRTRKGSWSQLLFRKKRRILFNFRSVLYQRLGRDPKWGRRTGTFCWMWTCFSPTCHRVPFSSVSVPTNCRRNTCATHQHSDTFLTRSHTGRWHSGSGHFKHEVSPGARVCRWRSVRERARERAWEGKGYDRIS